MVIANIICVIKQFTRFEYSVIKNDKIYLTLLGIAACIVYVHNNYCDIAQKNRKRKMSSTREHRDERKKTYIINSSISIEWIVHEAQQKRNSTLICTKHVTIKNQNNCKFTQRKNVVLLLYVLLLKYRIGCNANETEKSACHLKRCKHIGRQRKIELTIYSL